MSGNIDQQAVLKVTVTGGGPVGLSFGLLLESLMGDDVAIKIYDGRWTQKGSHVVWKNEALGNARRQQVVTLQSRQYLKLPQEIQDRLFEEGTYSEMWPKGRDSIKGYPPRNVRIAHIEDKLLEIANQKSENIQLIAERFKIEERHEEVADQHLLAICEGVRSRTRKFFINKFGVADKSLYSLDGKHLQDIVLGLRVKSELPDPTAVLLTVVQNRFLLNSLRGNGFLNMRLTDEESKAVKGIDENWVTKDCIQSQPCLMERTETPGVFGCSTHGTRFLPPLLREAPLWLRIQDGLKLFGVKEENLTAVTAFRLDMVQRSRFTVQLSPPTQKTPGTFGCLLGDAANAIHFWPGRGLNSGIASAVSLARCLNENWRGRPFREADFTRHEGLMSMLQYRHKSRGWRAMTGTDDHGTLYAIKEKMKEGFIEEEVEQLNNKDSDIDTLMDRLSQIRDRLKGRISPLPNDDALRTILTDLKPATLRTLVVSKAWDTVNVGGEEVDVDLLFEEPELSVLVDPEPASSQKPPVDKTRIFASLIYRGGAKEGHNLTLKLDISYDIHEANIGRKGADFILADPTVSRLHAIITRDEKELIIQNKSKTGGTYINRKKLELDQKQQLQHGDQVRFGQYVTYKVELLPAP